MPEGRTFQIECGVENENACRGKIHAIITKYIEPYTVQEVEVKTAPNVERIEETRLSDASSEGGDEKPAADEVDECLPEDPTKFEIVHTWCAAEGNQGLASTYFNGADLIEEITRGTFCVTSADFSRGTITVGGDDYSTVMRILTKLENIEKHYFRNKRLSEVHLLEVEGEDRQTVQLGFFRLMEVDKQTKMARTTLIQVPMHQYPLLSIVRLQRYDNDLDDNPLHQDHQNLPQSVAMASRSKSDSQRGSVSGPPAAIESAGVPDNRRSGHFGMKRRLRVRPQTQKPPPTPGVPRTTQFDNFTDLGSELPVPAPAVIKSTVEQLTLMDMADHQDTMDSLIRPLLPLPLRMDLSPSPVVSIAENLEEWGQEPAYLGERLQEVSEVETREFRRTMQQQKGLITNSAIKLNNGAKIALENSLGFVGLVELKMEIGRILFREVPEDLMRTRIDLTQWEVFPFKGAVPGAVVEPVFTDCIGSELTCGYSTIHIDGETFEWDVKEFETIFGRVYRHYPTRSNKERLQMNFKRTTDNELRVLRVVLRRETRYTTHPKELKITLCVTELQRLRLSQSTVSPGVYTASVGSHADMVSDNHLWYSVSLVSQEIDALFKENSDMDVGEEPSWTPDEIIENKIIERLESVSNKVIRMIDNVGSSNLSRHWLHFVNREQP
ncbi:hypothetical protein GP486_001817 [Trichoglossum hirsutum]|uniref:DUF7905 domain-containing protein n=1 Tax=Trichoglossum hirsutum TaxID=265104 RepID=A0A9P8LGA5_9PEZI|nr:hypothetical protein GP486_001817 [Trichoglossum hirsutum]